ncbi:MAG: phage tail tape measure protein [Rhodocyclaceae bacterium]|nr:phage tail tape measure protein [Rhodocyclaceae bacterium]
MSDRQLELRVLFTAVDKFLRPVKSITQGASDASKALKENTASAKELNRALGQIDAFKKVQADAAITANTFTATRRKIDELKAAMDQVGVPTKAMVKEMDRLNKESDRLRQKHQSLVTTEQQLFEKLKAGGVDTSRLADEQRRLASASAEATNASRRLSAALEVENQKMKQLHAARAEMNKLKATGDKLASGGAKAMAAGAAVSAAGSVPVMAYAKAEDSATQMKVAMMTKGGKVSEDFEKINALAEKLGNRLPGTTSDFQDMMTMLIRQGMQSKAILGGLGEATAYLAVQLKMAPSAASEFASQLQDATGTADKDMMGLMDRIQKTFNLGVNQDYMLQGFSKLSAALPILKKNGVEAADALAPLLTMANQSGMTDGGSAGNAYRKIFQQSLDAKKMAKGNAELAGTGVKLDFTDGKGSFGGIDKMFAELDKLKGVNDQQRLAALKKMFGDDAETLQALTIMMNKGASGYRDVQAKMENQASIQERVNAQLGTLKSLWDAASGTFTNALVAFGESVAPELHATAEWLGNVAGNVQAWARENPRFAAGIMTVVKYLGLLLLTLGGLAVGVGTVLGPIAMLKFGLTTMGVNGSLSFEKLGKAWEKMGSAFQSVSKFFMANPILLAIAAIALAAFLIYRYWEPIKAFFGGIWDQVRQAFNGGLTGILALIANWSPIGLFYQAMAAVLGYFGIELPGKFTEFGANIMAGLVGGIMAGIQSARDAIAAAGEAVVGFFKEKLGIHSPSRVFAELGGFTMAGLEEGLAGGEDGPLSAVAETAKKIAGIGAGLVIGGTALANDIAIDTQSPISALATSGGANTERGSGHGEGDVGGGNTFIFNITAAPGMDENALARMVRMEFENIQREQAARRRSRLSDVD